MLRVYTAEIPKNITDFSLPNKERELEISSSSSEKVKKEKYSAFKLLEYALLNTFNKPLSYFNLKKNSNGKWVCDNFYLSISHSEKVVAVCLSNSPCGVDVQTVNKLKTASFEKAILSEKELEDFCKLNLDEKEKTDFLIETFTKKESVFKRLDLPLFKPKEIELESVSTFSFILEDKKYYLSVSSQKIDKLEIIEKVKI